MFPQREYKYVAPLFIFTHTAIVKLDLRISKDGVSPYEPAVAGRLRTVVLLSTSFWYFESPKSLSKQIIQIASSLENLAY